MLRDLEYIFWFDKETSEPKMLIVDEDRHELRSAGSAERQLETKAKEENQVWNYTLIMETWYQYQPNPNSQIRKVTAKSLKPEDVPAVFRAMLLLHLP